MKIFEMGRFYITFILIAFLAQNACSMKKKRAAKPTPPVEEAKIVSAEEKMAEEMEAIDNEIKDASEGAKADETPEDPVKSFEEEFYEVILLPIKDAINSKMPLMEDTLLHHLFMNYGKVLEEFTKSSIFFPKEVKNTIEEIYTNHKEEFKALSEKIATFIRYCNRKRIKQFLTKLNNIPNLTSNIESLGERKDKLEIAYKAISGILRDPNTPMKIQEILPHIVEIKNVPVKMYENSYTFIKTIYKFITSLIRNILTQAIATNETFARLFGSFLYFIHHVEMTSNVAFKYLSEIVDPATDLTLGEHFESILRMLSDWQVIDDITEIFGKVYNFGYKRGIISIDDTIPSPQEETKDDQELPEGGQKEEISENAEMEEMPVEAETGEIPTEAEKEETPIEAEMVETTQKSKKGKEKKSKGKGSTALKSKKENVDQKGGEEEIIPVERKKATPRAGRKNITKQAVEGKTTKQAVEEKTTQQAVEKKTTPQTGESTPATGKKKKNSNDVAKSPSGN